MSVTTIYMIRAKQGKEGDLLEILQQGREFALGVEGCTGFQVYQGNDDPTKFVMAEHWESQQHHQKHFEANVVASGVLERAQALMKEPFSSPYESYYVLR